VHIINKKELSNYKNNYALLSSYPKQLRIYKEFSYKADKLIDNNFYKIIFHQTIIKKTYNINEAIDFYNKIDENFDNVDMFLKG